MGVIYIDEKTILDTTESMVYDLEAKHGTEINKLKFQVDYLIDEKQKHDEKLKKQRTYWHKRNVNKENDKFIKQYTEGWCDLLELRKNKDLSFSDAGKFAFLCTFIQKDTGLIVNPETDKPMTRNEMASAIGDDRSNFHKSIKEFIDKGLVVQKGNKGSRELYYINPNYAFNGYSRVNANVIILNNCTIGDNAVIAPQC